MNSCHILVVEDEAIAAQALEGFLTCKGYRVTLAADGQEGLEAMEREPADAIVTDLRMPRLDGREMIRRLRAKGIDRPIIIMTGYTAFATADDHRDHANHSPTVVLRKPIDFTEILSSLHRLIGSAA
ncbi:MAG TPA: response regulator [Alphaproteobacteria bacterium]|nr:response regulator [Alphaproteobacteria bacterium]